jgi:hypothetical protein
MTRAEFVRAYAKRSSLDDGYALLGQIRIAGHVMVALPCACGNEGCEGWAMLGANEILDHLRRDAPEPLGESYRLAVVASGGAS